MAGLKRKAGDSAPWKSALKGVLMLGFALPLGFLMLTTSIDKLRWKSWPATRAEIVDVDTHQQAKSGARCLLPRYRYVVDGKAYVARRMTVARSSFCYRDQTVIDAALRRFQPGAAVWIRYDPGNPGKAALYADELGFMDILFGLLALLVGMAGVQLLRQASRAPKPTVGCHS